MHERTLLSGLMNQLNTISRENGNARIVTVRVRIGAMAHISADHLREHFEEMVPGTPAEGARLEATEGTDIYAPDAQDIVLESVDVESVVT